MRGSRSALVPVLAASAITGVAYVALMPPGLPYDEPSHWMNVLFYAEQHRLPQLDDAGVTYEAQMGPVAYALAALVASPFVNGHQDLPAGGHETCPVMATRTAR